MRPFPPECVEARHRDGMWGSQTIYGAFSRHVATDPHRVAVIDPPNRAAFTHGVPQRLTYGELDAFIERIATSLSAAGLRAGDVLLVQMPNVHELVALYLAAARTGVVISPVPVQYRKAELAQIIAVAKPAGYCAKPFRDIDFIAMARGELGFEGKLFGFGESSSPDVIDLSATISVSAADNVLAEPSSDQLFSICWTSGTEGVPKGIPKTHNNWLASSRTALESGWLPLAGTLLVPFPLVNAAAIGGLLMGWIGAGATLVLHHPFQVDTFLAQIRDESVDYTIVAPALLASIVERERAAPGSVDLSPLRVIGTGSASLDPSVIEDIERLFGLEVVNLFGSNEGIQLASDRAAVPDPRDRASLYPRTGDLVWNPDMRTANKIQFRLLDPEGDDIISEPGRVGEMAIEGPSVFPGYLQPDGDLDRSGFTADGFFRTGDLFEYSTGSGMQANYLRFVGRRKELIVRGGMKIAPAELDGALSAHPTVLEAAVAAWPDARLGERVCAFVVPRPGETPTLEALCAMLDSQGVAKFKWPERLELIDALPRNALAKVQRNQLAMRIAELTEAK